MIAFVCGGCGQGLQEQDLVGKVARCPQCGQATAVARAPARLGPDPTEAGATSVSAAETADGQAAARPAELYDFLAPPEGPGELGRLGGYRVRKVLGAGGMGVVFEAEDPGLERPVALKAMLPALAASAAARQRFLREARAVAAIKHDHVVTIYQVGEDRGTPFIAMELLEGEALDARLRREGALAPAEALRIAREAAEALAAAHGRGLVHRDVKPGNIWLEGPRRRVKVLDFGLARPAADGPQLTQEGAIAGTPAYMAPEQVHGARVDARGDLFSLGCVLYRACTGRPAFKGEGTVATLMAVATDPPRPPQELDPRLPPAVCDLILRLLAKSPAERPPSAQAVSDAIREIEEGVTVAAAAPPAAERRARAAGTGKRALLVVLLAAGGLLTGGLVARVARTGRPPAPPDEKAPAAAGPVQVQPLWTAAGAHEAGKAFHVGLAPDGEWLVSGGVNRRLRFWDVAGGRHLGPDVPLHEVHGLVLAPHGPRFATLEAWPRRVTVWDARTRGRWELPNANFGRALAAAFSGDGGLLAVRNKDRGVSLWDIARRRETAALPPAPAEFHGLQLSADGRWAATGAPAGTRSPATLLLWDAARPDRPPAQAPAGGAVRPGLRFSADGQELLAPVGATVRRWGLPGLDRAGAPVRLDLAPAGRFVLGPEGRAAVGVGEDPATLVVCDGATGRRRAVLLGAGANVQSVSVTRDGSQVAAACNDGSIRLWRLPGGPEGPG